MQQIFIVWYEKGISLQTFKSNAVGKSCTKYIFNALSTETNESTLVSS